MYERKIYNKRDKERRQGVHERKREKSERKKRKEDTYRIRKYKQIDSYYVISKLNKYLKRKRKSEICEN